MVHGLLPYCLLLMAWCAGCVCLSGAIPRTELRIGGRYVWIGAFGPWTLSLAFGLAWCSSGQVRAVPALDATRSVFLLAVLVAGFRLTSAPGILFQQPPLRLGKFSPQASKPGTGRCTRRAGSRTMAGSHLAWCRSGESRAQRLLSESASRFSVCAETEFSSKRRSCLPSDGLQWFVVLRNGLLHWEVTSSIPA